MDNINNSVENSGDNVMNDLICKYELEKCIKWIEENNYQRTCLQFCEPLLIKDSTNIALYLQKVLKRPFYVLADTSYGSCCVDEVCAEHINGDSVIHFGHSCLSPVVKIPVLYIFGKKDLNLLKLKENFVEFDDAEQLIIFYSDSYHHLHLELQSLLKDKSNFHISRLCLDKNESISEGEQIMCGRIFQMQSKSQISAVYIGNDDVTLTNLVLSLPDLKWYHYSEEEKLEEYNFKRSKFLMQRSHLVEKIKEANVIGILVGTLAVSNYLDAVERVKLLAKRKGKKCYIFAVGKPNVAKLANFPQVDVFVCIACLENSLLKEFKDFYKVIVSLFEVEMALGDRPYSLGYTSDFRELLQGGSFHKCDLDSASCNETGKSQELIGRHSGTLMETYGAQYLQNQTWKGLEQKIGETKVEKAVKGRSGIPQAYQNELSLDENKFSDGT